MRKRLTREESREQTTKHLLDAGQKLIAQKGLSATSVEDIAAAAGYSRGAFYSNFDTKYDLFIEVLRRDHRDTHDVFLALCDDSVPFEQLIGRLRDLYGQQYRNDESFLNWAEARMLAARDPEFRARLHEVDAEKRGDINAVAEYIFRRAGGTPPLPASVMAMGFVSLIEGVKLTMLAAPDDISPADAEALLSLFLDTVIRHSVSREAAQ
jgi:AcrR family transcriptional regulator